jgi:hypothetical protein
MSHFRAPFAAALALAAPIALFAYQQAGSSMPQKKTGDMPMKGMDMKGAMTDGQKIASAEAAGPAKISKAAAIMDWPDKEGGQMRQLRAGSNGWMCMSDGGTPATPPMCVDKQWQGWIDAMIHKSTPKGSGVGLAYMLRGDKGASNTDPNATGPTATNQWVVAPAHVMVIVPDSKLLDASPTDPTTGGPWVMWKGTPYAHLMVPVSATEMAKMTAK